MDEPWPSFINPFSSKYFAVDVFHRFNLTINYLRNLIYVRSRILEMNRTWKSVYIGNSNPHEPRFKMLHHITTLHVMNKKYYGTFTFNCEGRNRVGLT